ncbi:copper chaperone CopZ [Bacillaceae bacterium]
MEKVTLNVEGMSCSHCVQAIEGALSKVDGVANASVDLNAKTVHVEFDAGKVNLEKIKEVIEDQGYDVR